MVEHRAANHYTITPENNYLPYCGNRIKNCSEILSFDLKILGDNLKNYKRITEFCCPKKLFGGPNLRLKQPKTKTIGLYICCVLLSLFNFVVGFTSISPVKDYLKL